MRVEYSALARADIEAIGAYITSQNPRAATNVRDKIKSVIDLLTEFPHLGRQQTTAGMRKIGAGKYPYNIYYQVDEIADVINIVTVRHAARRREFTDL